jgi:hypothetical protein
MDIPVTLSRQIHEYISLFLGGGLHKAVQLFKASHFNGLRKVSVVAQERAMGAIGVESGPGLLFINPVLGKEAGDYRFAYPPLLSTYKVNPTHYGATPGY